MTDKIMPTIDEATKVLQEAASILKAIVGIRFFMDGGTLLGFHRDSTFCEDDHDDIDLSTFAIDYWNRKDEIIQAFKNHGYEVYREWPRDTERNRSGQLAFKKNNVKVDLMFKEIKPKDEAKAGEKMVWWTVYGGKNGVTYKAVPMRLLAEKTPGKYLEYRYGDWNKKVHRSEYSCYTSDKSIVKENTYEAI